MMRTTLTLEPDLFSIARHMAQTSGESLGGVISRLAKAGLAALNQPRFSTTNTASFPVFSVPTGAPMFGAEVVALDADEH